ncbi:phage tail protein [Cronobacter sakazakii]|uniref:phage tail protein n=1 Tax=Cronobacter sakazakii TaxID=28141 RepID=UPI000A117E3E|nr:phage tail protein [Cronobacter sakazakii]
MAIKTFSWPTQIQSGMQGEYTATVRRAKFGDGYEQVAADGINPEFQSWPVVMTGTRSEMLAVLAFVRRHVAKSFIWTAPNDETSLWRVDPESIRSTPLSSNVMTINATFKQAYAP